ncbi:hypothetical protein ABQX22_04575 [Xanthomonas sp. WHRI 1810A]|uniref:hypothetical protein n=1 Tax=Xanthomonas sp. WHRI 1810A TaxID=3161565 RepID=UPI0032E90E14
MIDDDTAWQPTAWQQEALSQGLHKALSEHADDVRSARDAALARRGTLNAMLAALPEQDQRRLAAQIGETPWIF